MGLQLQTTVLNPHGKMRSCTDAYSFLFSNKDHPVCVCVCVIPIQKVEDGLINQQRGHSLNRGQKCAPFFGGHFVPVSVAFVNQCASRKHMKHEEEKEGGREMAISDMIMCYKNALCIKIKS